MNWTAFRVFREKYCRSRRWWKLRIRRLWFATTKGIAWLDPATFERNRNRVPPPVIITAVVSNGKSYAGSKALSLPACTENLEIDYTALSLAIPERVLFRYKLDGVDR